MTETQLKYQGFYNYANDKPEGECIIIFCSDWLKDHWAFYAFIGLDNYKRDIIAIQNLVAELNFRDGDTYVELIDHSDGLAELYHVLYQEGGSYAHWNALNTKEWDKHKRLFPVPV